MVKELKGLRSRIFELENYSRTRMGTDLHESFLQLVRLGIGHTESTDNTEKFHER